MPNLPGSPARNDADAFEGVPGHLAERLNLVSVLSHKVPPIRHLCMHACMLMHNAVLWFCSVGQLTASLSLAWALLLPVTLLAQFLPHKAPTQ